MPLKNGPAAIVTHLKDEGCEARGTHLANAIAFGFALAYYCTACCVVITVNINDAVEQVLTPLGRFFDVVIVDFGTDRRRRCAGLLLGPALSQFQAIAIIESNALVLRNFDEVAGLVHRVSVLALTTTLFVANSATAKLITVL